MKTCAALLVMILMLGATAACTRIETVRLQPETIEVGPGLRPVAGIQASATTAYLLFIPIPGGVELDEVVNRMLVVRAKEMGADKIAQLSFDIDPDGGIWLLWRIIGWRTAHARGIAVQVVAPPVDARADDGPEAAPMTDGATPGKP